MTAPQKTNGCESMFDRTHPGFINFIRESNRIEGILHDPTEGEIAAHERLLNPQLQPTTVGDFQAVIAHGKPIVGLQLVGHDSGGQPMRANLFWLNDEQWAKIKRLIPMNRPGQKPRNNRRILSGIIHVLKTGCRWQDCPPEYGPHTTVYNRFNRWSGRGIWQQIFETVSGSSEPPEQAALDSTHVKAHRYAGGGKGGPRNRRSVSPKVAGTARFMGLPTSCAARGS
jgi:transposase